MNAVLQRELLVQARSRGTTWLRLLAGGLAVLGFYFGTGTLGAFGRVSGRELFLFLHVATCIIAALACPLLTADSFLSERKQGTLPLLFLTPLSAGRIVAGKYVAHLLRAASLWLSAAPVLLFPLWLGGVDGRLLLGILLLEASLLTLALMIGLAASAHGESIGGVIAISYLVLGLLVMFGGFPALGILRASPALSGPTMIQTAVFLLTVLSVAALVFWTAFGTAVTEIRECWRQSMSVPTSAPPPDAEVVPAFQKTWYERWVERRQRRGTPAEAAAFGAASAPPDGTDECAKGAPSRRSRWIHRGRPVLDWLWARAGMVTGLAVCQTAFVAFVSLLTCGESYRPGPGMGIATLQLLMASFPAVRALQHERQSGALELLLVTPLRPQDYVLSHCRKVWHLFGPGAGTYAMVVVGCGVVYGKWHGLISLTWLVGCLAALPVIGFWLNLLSRSILVSVVALVVMTLILPLWVSGAAMVTLSPEATAWLSPLLATSLVALMVRLAWAQSAGWIRRRTLPGRRNRVAFA